MHTDQRGRREGSESARAGVTSKHRASETTENAHTRNTQVHEQEVIPAQGLGDTRCTRTDKHTHTHTRTRAGYQRTPSTGPGEHRREKARSGGQPSSKSRAINRMRKMLRTPRRRRPSAARDRHPYDGRLLRAAGAGPRPAPVPILPRTHRARNEPTSIAIRVHCIQTRLPASWARNL